VMTRWVTTSWITGVAFVGEWGTSSNPNKGHDTNRDRGRGALDSRGGMPPGMPAAFDALDARRGWLPRLETAPVPTWAVVLPGPGRVRKCRDRAYWDKQARRGTGAPGHEPNSAQPPRASRHA